MSSGQGRPRTVFFFISYWKTSEKKSLWGSRVPPKSNPGLASAMATIDPFLPRTEGTKLFRRLGFHGGESTGETALPGVIRRFVDREGLHRVGGDGDRETTAYRVAGSCGIHEHEALIFIGTLEIQFAILRFDYAGSHRKDFANLLLGGREGY